MNYTRRDLLGVALQYPGVKYRDYSRMLPDFLRRHAEAAYKKRNAALAALTTRASIAARRQWVRQTFWKLAGGELERTPLNARVTGSFERKRYRVEKVVYESRPNFHVPANLYIPLDAQPPYPGVLFQLGHSANGKAYASYQRCCQGLVQLGYLVLAFDPMGQGERIYYPDASGTKTRLRSSDEEHTVPGKQMLLFGDSATRMQVWDSIRSLDYLAAHPLVDAKRLASTGQSGGGTTTMLLAAVDDRLAAAVVCSGNTENLACANFNPPGSTDDAEQNFLNGGPLGFDRWDLLYPLAPKPLLVTVSDKDFYGTYSPSYIENGWEEFQKLRRVYSAMGAADKLAWGGTPLPHSLAYDTRMQTYNWFERWLKGSATKIDREPPTAPEPDEMLWVSKRGNVVSDFGGETPFSMVSKRVPVKQPVSLERLLAVEKRKPEWRTLKRVPGSGIVIEAMEFRTTESVWLPAWLFAPGQEGAGVLVVLDPAGRNSSWMEDGLCQKLAAAGCTVCVPDLRGLGDMQPEFGRGSPRYERGHQDEENYAWASMMLGVPLVGQRVTDLLQVCAALQTRWKRVRVAARGQLTMVAEFAAALDPGIESLYLAGRLESFKSLVERETPNHPFANYVPGILNHTDLPEVRQSISPRRIVTSSDWTFEALLGFDRADKLSQLGQTVRLIGQAV